MAGLALTYFLLTLPALLLTTAPGYALPLWPAAGLALAALAVWGWRLWPGIWVGAFAAEWLHQMQLTVTFDASACLAQTALIASGDALQAVLGALLVRRFLRAAEPLANGRDALVFLALGGPLACLIAATVGAAALHFFGAQPTDATGLTWYTWWVGDSLGVLLFAPLTLLVLPESGRRWRGHAMSIAVPVLIIGVLVMVGYIWVIATERAEQRERLAANGYDLMNRLENVLYQRRERLRTIEGLFEARETITPEEFAAFNRLAEARSGVEIIEWAPRVAQAGREAFEAAARREGRTDFALTEIGTDYALVPASPRADYFPLWLASSVGIHPPFGFDFAASAANRAAMHRAAETTLPALVARETLSYHDPLASDWRLLVPIYRTGFNAKDADATERHAALRGFAIGVINPGHLWASEIEHATSEGLDLRIVALADWNQSRPLLIGVAAGDEIRQVWSGRLDSFAGPGLRLDVWSREPPITGQSVMAKVYFTGSLLAVLLTSVAVFVAAGNRRRLARDLAQRTANENRLNALIESVQVGVIVHDAQTVVIRVNAVAEQLLQVSAAQVLGKTASDPAWHFVAEDGRRLATADYPVSQVIARGEALKNLVLGVVFGDGRPMAWMLVSAAPIFDAQKKLSEVAVTFMDITARRRLEQWERERVGIMEALGADVPLASVLKRITHAVEAEDPRALCSILLLDESGKRLRHGAAPSLPDFYVQAIDGVEIGPEVGSCGTAAFTGQRVIVADIASHPYWKDFRDLAARAGLAACWSEPILNAAGRVLGTFAIYLREPGEPGFEDFNRMRLATALARLAIEQNQARVTLILERDKLAAAFSNVAIGLVMCDARGGNISMNPAALKFHGFSSEHDMGKRFDDYADDWELRYTDGRLMPREEWPLARALRSDCVKNYDTVLHNLKTNFELACSYTSALVRNSEGEVSLIVMTMFDITERRRAEDEIRQINASLEQRVRQRTAELTQAQQATETARQTADAANRAKSEFLATMSHEIRTPMNGVIGMVDVLQQTSLQGYQIEMVDTIRDSAFSLLGIIEDILDFSKIEAGKLDIENLPTSIAEVVEKACGMLDHLAVRKNVDLTLFTDPALPALVQGDAQRLRQIIINLANNAIKFSSGLSRPGQVSVRAVLAGQRPDGIIVNITVSDNGIGMDDATQGRLFTAFSQADASTTRRFGGTGLGLSIARNLAGLMGGDIAVQSAPDEGSSFSLRLPGVQVADGAAPDVSRGSGTASSAVVAGLRCLVVGDAESLADDWGAYLVAAGAQIERASDLAAARELAAPTAPGAPGPWLWLIDADHDAPDVDALHAIATARIADNPRILIVGRGKRRRLRRLDADHQLWEVDANVLTRQALLKKVAIVAGRLSANEEPTAAGKSAAALAAPARADALKQGRLILVAEDNETNQKVIVQQLALLGFAADVAGDGREALARWQSGEYALLLTDLHMPRMDGYELTAAIRAAELGARRMPIIALTANVLRGEALRCVDAGMDDYQSKPTPLTELRAMLEKWLPTAVSPAPTLAVSVDVSVLAALVGDDPATIREFLQDFRASARSIAAELCTACANAETAPAGALAHKLKSSARSVGALALGELCAEMEAAGKAGQGAALTSLWPRFEAEMAAVDAALADLTARDKKAGSES